MVSNKKTLIFSTPKFPLFTFLALCLCVAGLTVCSILSDTYVRAMVERDPNGRAFPLLKNDQLLRAALGQKTKHVPVWVMRQAGRYLPEFQEVRKNHSFKEICKTPSLACEITLQPIRRFNLDGSIIFSDILVVNEALGIDFELVPKEGIRVLNPLSSPDDVARLKTDVDVREALGYVFDAITTTRHALEGKVPLFGFSGAPWTLMVYLVENGSAGQKEAAKRWLYAHPESSHRLLGMLSEVIVRYLIGQVLAGAQILQVFESHAGVLSIEQFGEFSVKYLRQIAHGVRDGLTERGVKPVPMVVFAKDAHHSYQELAHSGYDVIGLDWGVDPKAVRKLVGNDVTLQGNLDPCALFASKEEIKSLTHKMMDRFGTQRYIANLGHGINQFTDPDHLQAFIDAIHSYNA